MEGLKVSSSEQTNDVVLSLNGRFTFNDYNNFRKTVADALQQNPKTLTIDMAALEFIDSAALGMLLLARDEASKISVDVRIRGAQGQVERVLDVARFKTLFEFI